MPELPDVTVYVEQLAARLAGDTLRSIKLLNPFLLRTALPPIDQAVGRQVAAARRLGKRVVLVLATADSPGKAVGATGEPAGTGAASAGPADTEPWFLVIHLMIAGRLHWLATGRKPPRGALLLLGFDAGTLMLTEAGTLRRASLHLVAGEAALAALDPGGLEPMACDAAAFAERLRRGNHTLKRALTDPQAFSGIGNAYGDEILHRARLSPVTLTRALSEAEVGRLWAATQAVLREWTDRLRAEAAAHGGWPDKVTAFREGMAVHGRYGQPCPDCGAPVQRIVYAANETNYCARCQTGGRLLADRALSRLLKASWPRTVDDL